ncbi:hypothetical protein C1Y40_00201 [Mycobacterium talmoniae]|uniref:Uncharacterized protein n=1 Tax=Mycobacterium talmoniae TaxID=1858794 RepID=A0A2S8BSE1_9MYCO|nr:hypothetical protein C1Y40_00201 [Mycobacterium talmoniae]
MGVHVHRQVEPAAQRGDQGGGRRCPQQPGHVLDTQHVRPGVNDLLGQLEVIVQGVDLLVRVGQVAGVAHRDFGDGRTGFAYGIDRRAHRLDVVEGVEDAEDVHTRRGGLLHKRRAHQLRIRRVADGVAAPQQHLQTDVGQRFAQRGQPLPRVLFEEPQRHVVGRPAPALHRQQLRGQPGDVRRDLQQPAGAHPGGQQRLVRVAERGVGHPDRPALPHPPGETLRPQLHQPLFGSRRRRGVQIDLRQLVVRVHRRRPGACGWLTVTSAR